MEVEKNDSALPEPDIQGLQIKHIERNRRKPNYSLAIASLLFLLPALLFYIVFELWPIIQTIWYSFYNWNGIDVSTFIGLQNYKTVFSDPELYGSIIHAFILIVPFSFIPIAIGLVMAALIKEIKSGAVSGFAQVCLFLPRVIPGAAAAVAWTWMLADQGTMNQILRGVGLGRFARAWLGQQDTALAAVGVIGFWLQLGFCIVLLLSGMGGIDQSLYEAASLDGAGWWRRLFSITIPGLRGQIGVCLTMTIVAALASFDVVFMSTQGGPGYATMVPGVEVYRLAFTQQSVGLASALAVALMVLVLLVVGPLQRLINGKRVD
ncbi:carbohydrate ABC transporter permease [Bifidobacterium aquikefiri]|uniref:carbohydrate ABC transporter permease n=1 Tax=Bifidobacterium aquikefiri TaxID=1653207 RepID=UPI0039EBED85